MLGYIVRLKEIISYGEARQWEIVSHQDEALKEAEEYQNQLVSFIFSSFFPFLLCKIKYTCK